MFLTGERQSPYDKLHEEDKDKIKTVLFIINKFSVSFRDYSGLAQEFQELPRPYLVERQQKEIDKTWSEQITHTPGTHPGAELPFKELLRHEIAKHVSIGGKLMTQLSMFT